MQKKQDRSPSVDMDLPRRDSGGDSRVRLRPSRLVADSLRRRLRLSQVQAHKRECLARQGRQRRSCEHHVREVRYGGKYGARAWSCIGGKVHEKRVFDLSVAAKKAQVQAFNELCFSGISDLEFGRCFVRR